MRGTLFNSPLLSVILTSSASTLNNNLFVTAHWSPTERSLHVSILELRAIRLPLKSFLPQVKHRVVQAVTDNMMALYYLNKQGGADSLKLHKETKSFWNWYIEHFIHPIAIHVAKE